MYSTCIHCHAGLGSNESVEAFPTGRRLAFDAAKGRLWVVCPKCRRWNLTPLEERWEAIEQCERLYRDTRLRASTDNIGLAKVREGTELVRIGSPLRPEMAAWRYAGDLRRRWLRYGGPIAVMGSVAGTFGMVGMFGPAVQIGGAAGIGVIAAAYAWFGQRVRTILPSGRTITLNASRNSRVRLISVGAGWGIGGDLIGQVVTGPKAAYTFRSVLTSRNFRGGRPEDVSDAVALLSEVPDPDRFISRVARVAERTGGKWPLPVHVGVALEMALHEDVERRALDGELADLRQQWAMAEEIASIADNMLLPSTVEDAIQQLRSR
jgi:hypothetical protein